MVINGKKPGRDQPRRMSHTGSGPSPEACAGHCFITQDFQWLGGIWRGSTNYGVKGFALPDVSEPAAQLLSVQSANRLFAQEAFVINKHVWWRWLEQKIKRMQWERGTRRISRVIYFVCLAQGNVKQEEVWDAVTTPSVRKHSDKICIWFSGPVKLLICIVF